jgi:hypothetical protein
MALTFAADLAAVKQDVWTSLLFKGIRTRKVVQQFATYHDLQGSNGGTVHFPMIGALAAQKSADTVATTYTPLVPSDSTAVAYEIYSAVGLSRFAQATSPIKNVSQVAASMAAALAVQVETDLLAEGAANGQVVSTTAIALTVAIMGTARNINAALGFPESNLGYVLNPTGEASLLTDSNLTNAATWGGQSIVENGAVTRIWGAPVFVSPYLPANKSLLIGANTLHYAVLEAPRLDIQWDADTRSDKAVLSTVIAVKYAPTDVAVTAQIRHT